MEPWSYTSEGKGLLFPDEIDLQVDDFARSKKPLMEWDNKPNFSFESNGLVSDREAVESMDFVELGFPDFVRKPFHGNQGLEMLSGEVGSSSSHRAVSPSCIITSNSCFEEVASEEKLSSSGMETNNQDLSLIDLKLGRLADCKGAESSKLFKHRPVLSSAPPSLLTKRARKANSHSQAAFCQVHGCNKDLSSSKDYHKRHKVCDVHSKTTKVIVNGIEQRFCQQCSRFHLLAEFDEGKRSCRKRLAGHNERRRKPQLDTLSGKHKLLQSYQDTRYLGTSFPKRTPFVFPDIFRADIVHPGKSDQANWFTHIKLEGESFYSPQSAIPLANGQLIPKSFLHLHDIGKQHCLGVPSAGTENCDVTVSTIQELSGASISSRALSLLSAQSQGLSSHLTGIPMASPQIMQGDSAHHVGVQIFEKPLRASSMEQCGPSGLYSHGLNSMDVGKMGSIMFSDASHAADFQVCTEGGFQDSGMLNAKYCPSSEHGSTVDWLQLSSHLQRVERQKNSIQVKQENEDSCYFPTFRVVCNQQG